MCGSAPSPQAPVLPPAPPPAPTPADPMIAAAKAKARQQAGSAAGRASTILSSPQGDLSPAETTKKTALGI